MSISWAEPMGVVLIVALLVLVVTPTDRSEHTAQYLVHHTRMVDDKVVWKMDRAIEEALPCAFGKRKSHF